MFDKPHDIAFCVDCFALADVFEYKHRLLCRKCAVAAYHADSNPQGEYTLEQWAVSHIVTHEAPQSVTWVRLNRHEAQRPACPTCHSAMLSVNYFDVETISVLIGMACCAPRCKAPVMWAMGAPTANYAGRWQKYAHKQKAVK